MKREIKFRAKSLDGELIYFELHESHQSGDSEVFYVNDIPCESGTEQEYTGLKDKNGKEIYEGDIIEMGVSSNQHKPIKYEVSWGSWSWMKGITIGKPMYSFDAIEARSRAKIIGNIYENPELLAS